ncbi:MAG: hypothetical protein H6597_03975 [Flavobacteriales bacterium]|nr:hypothetical protein [Flavobacteriales bacterium]MCB9193668.1 hypothetical protein [Flavobacteriales bacterium]
MLLGSRMWPNLGITACATVCMLLLGRLYMERYLEAGFGPEQASDPARSSRTGQGDPS